MSQREYLVDPLVSVAEMANAVVNATNPAEYVVALEGLRSALRGLSRYSSPQTCWDCSRSYCVNPTHLGRPQYREAMRRDV